MKFYGQDWSVKSVKKGSLVSYGDNFISHMVSHTKKNEGWGSLQGHQTHIYRTLSFLKDEDHIDCEKTLQNPSVHHHGER